MLLELDEWLGRICTSRFVGRGGGVDPCRSIRPGSKLVSMYEPCRDSLTSSGRWTGGVEREGTSLTRYIISVKKISFSKYGIVNFATDQWRRQLRTVPESRKPAMIGRLQV